MRAQEELPGWVTHVLNVTEGGVTPMTREKWRGPAGALPKAQSAEEKDGRDEERAVTGELIVDLKGVGVKYGNRTVSKFSSAHFFAFFLFFSAGFLKFSLPFSSLPFHSIFSRNFSSFRVLSFLCARVLSSPLILLSFLRIPFFPQALPFLRTSSFPQVPFRSPELSLSPRVDPSADDAMNDRFLRILRGRFVKVRGGIYKGRMVGTFLSGLLSILFL